MWELALPDLNEPLDLSILSKEQRELYDKTLTENLPPEEFEKRQEEFLNSILPPDPERPDLINGWIEPDGTFHRLLKPNRHEMWSLEKFGMRHRELMAKGWVKVTQWDKHDNSVGMYIEDLTIDQELKIKELNVKRTSCSKFFR
jgi:hypothetical protein